MRIYFYDTSQIIYKMFNNICENNMKFILQYLIRTVFVVVIVVSFLYLKCKWLFQKGAPLYVIDNL